MGAPVYRRKRYAGEKEKLPQNCVRCPGCHLLLQRESLADHVFFCQDCKDRESFRKGTKLKMVDHGVRE